MSAGLLRGGGESTVGPYLKLSHKHPHPLHSLGLPTTLLSLSPLPWQPDGGITAQETEKGSSQDLSYKLDLGPAVGGWGWGSGLGFKWVPWASPQVGFTQLRVWAVFLA